MHKEEKNLYKKKLSTKTNLYLQRFNLGYYYCQKFQK